MYTCMNCGVFPPCNVMVPYDIPYPPDRCFYDGGDKVPHFVEMKQYSEKDADLSAGATGD